MTQIFLGNIQDCLPKDETFTKLLRNRTYKLFDNGEEAAQNRETDDIVMSYQLTTGETIYAIVKDDSPIHENPLQES